MSTNEGEELADKKGAACVETYTNANANTNVGTYMRLDVIQTAQVNSILSQGFRTLPSRNRKTRPKEGRRQSFKPM